MFEIPEDIDNRDERRPRRLRWVLIGLVIAAVLLLLALLAVTPTHIGDVLADPRRYEDGVTVSGIVTGRVSILGRGGFGIEDGTGRIVVLTARTPPPDGVKARITGEVKELLNNMVVIIER